MPQRRQKKKAAARSTTYGLGLPTGDAKTGLLTNEDAGVLYTMKVAERPPEGRVRHRWPSRRGSATPTPILADAPSAVLASRLGDAPTGSIITDSIEDAMQEFVQPRQYTISKMRTNSVSWFSRFGRSFGFGFPGPDNDRTYIYRPSKAVAHYVNWTFNASMSAVFLSFMFGFIITCFVYAGLFMLAGEYTPECLLVGGGQYGANPNSKFADAFAMSWTTFTTVGYGTPGVATGTDFGTLGPHKCAGVIFLCTLESFSGLIYAGMCAAILFGKVNRIQSHAHLTFANTICLQYAEVTLDVVDEEPDDSDCDEPSDEESSPGADGSNELQSVSELRPNLGPRTATFRLSQNRHTFNKKYKGCPILTFQVVNDFCNKRGNEIIDGLMKVVGVKHKKFGGKISHTQLVRVNLVDYENPFFAQVWHGTHILDGSSPLLTQAARLKIRANGGSWPNKWFEKVDKIRRKLDFQHLIVTVAGVSNLSSCTVYAYKWYKFEDVIYGFDFAPLLYENEKTGKLEVDVGLVNDVREQVKGSGEELVEPPSDGYRSLATRRGTSTIFNRSANRSATSPTVEQTSTAKAVRFEPTADP